MGIDVLSNISQILQQNVPKIPEEKTKEKLFLEIDKHVFKKRVILFFIQLMLKTVTFSLLFR